MIDYKDPKEVIYHLVRLALEGKSQDLAMLVRAFAWKQRDPVFAQRVHDLLVPYGLQGSLLRGSNRNGAGEPKRLPLASELTGSDPEFTGELSTDEYIRSIRS